MDFGPLENEAEVVMRDQEMAEEFFLLFFSSVLKVEDTSSVPAIL